MLNHEMAFDKWPFSAILIVIVTSYVGFVHAKLYRECIGVAKNQQFVASLDDCAKYIYCDGNNSFESVCLDDNYFNGNEGKCEERAAVICKIGEQLAVGNTQFSPGSQVGQASQGYLGSLASSGSTGSVTNTNNNLNNNNMNNKYPSTNNSWNTSITSQVGGQQSQHAKQQQSLWTVLGNGVIGSEPVVGQSLNAIDMGNTGAATIVGNQPIQCPQRNGLSNIFNLPNAQSCASYYTCYNGIAIPMICPRQTYFSQETSRCERQQSVHCPLYRPVRLICNRGVYDYIPHSRNCAYYYLCSNGYLMIFQCPFQYLWHYERHTCVHRSQAKCFSSAIAQAMLS